MKYIILILTFFLISCKYQPDLGMLNDAQANYFSYFVNINGSNCIDMDGNVGLCAKQLPSNTTLTFRLAPRPYDYELRFVCSSKLNANTNINVRAAEEYMFGIEPSKFQGIDSFTCVGEIFPKDRQISISSRFEVRVTVYDPAHQRLPSPRYEYDRPKMNLLLGENALYSRVCTDDICRSYSKKTYLKNVKVNDRVFVWTESEIMRNSYLWVDNLD